jgi:hypothetical protein
MAQAPELEKFGDEHAGSRRTVVSHASIGIAHGDEKEKAPQRRGFST